LASDAPWHIEQFSAYKVHAGDQILVTRLNGIRKPFRVAVDCGVLDLMVNKVEQLPIGTRETLTRLACLGSMAGIPLLAMVEGRSEEEVQADLWEAVRRELIVRLEEGSYKFAHDRAWEASYSLIPEELRAEADLRIVRLLTDNTAPEKLGESIFQILNQINRGALLYANSRPCLTTRWPILLHAPDE
jgi:predicted ATPase